LPGLTQANLMIQAVMMRLWDGTLKCEEKRRKEKRKHFDTATIFLAQKGHR